MALVSKKSRGIIYQGLSSNKYNTGTVYPSELKDYLSCGLIGEDISRVKTIEFVTGTYAVIVSIYHDFKRNATLILETTLDKDKLMAETTPKGIKDLKKNLVSKIRKARDRS